MLVRDPSHDGEPQPGAAGTARLVGLRVAVEQRLGPAVAEARPLVENSEPGAALHVGVKPGVDLGTKLCFGTIAQTICEYLGVDASSLDGHSVWNEIKA